MIKEFMTDNGRIQRCTEKEYSLGQMEENILGSL